MQKTGRKNSHKERIFTLAQNKIDFAYQKDHQDKIIKEQRSIEKTIEVPSLLSANKVREALNDLQGWQSTDDHKMIYREFILHNFMAAIDLIDHIAIIAEDEKHHPDIHLTKYRNLRVGLTTHDVGGLSEKDFTVALKINGLPKLNNAIGINVQLQNKGPANKGSLITKDQSNKPEHKDKLMKKPRYEQKGIQVKKGKSKVLASKKNDDKTKGVQIERSLNRMDRSI